MCKLAFLNNPDPRVPNPALQPPDVDPRNRPTFPDVATADLFDTQRKSAYDTQSPPFKAYGEHQYATVGNVTHRGQAPHASVIQCSAEKPYIWMNVASFTKKYKSNDLKIVWYRIENFNGGENSINDCDKETNREKPCVERVPANKQGYRRRVTKKDSYHEGLVDGKYNVHQHKDYSYSWGRPKDVKTDQGFSRFSQNYEFPKFEKDTIFALQIECILGPDANDCPYHEFNMTGTLNCKPADHTTCFLYSRFEYSCHNEEEFKLLQGLTVRLAICGSALCPPCPLVCPLSKPPSPSCPPACLRRKTNPRNPRLLPWQSLSSLPLLRSVSPLSKRVTSDRRTALKCCCVHRVPRYFGFLVPGQQDAPSSISERSLASLET